MESHNNSYRAARAATNQRLSENVSGESGFKIVSRLFHKKLGSGQQLGESWLAANKPKSGRSKRQQKYSQQSHLQFSPSMPEYCELCTHVGGFPSDDRFSRAGMRALLLFLAMQVLLEVLANERTSGPVKYALALGS